jgi:hypothetical protein
VVRKILCFLGFHSWYSDSAFFYSVTRCNYCPTVDDENRLRRLEWERKLWEEEGEKGGDHAETLLKVSRRLFANNLKS